MSEYKLPSGRASVETEGGFLSEINYSYNATGKDKTIQELLNECLKLQAKVEQLRTDLHYCNGVSDLAMKHRDFAEAKVEKLEGKIKKAGDILAEHQTMTSPTYLSNAIAALKQEGE